MSEIQRPIEAVSVSVPATETSPLLGDDVTRNETTVEINSGPVAETKESTSSSEAPTVVQIGTVSGEEVRPTVDNAQTDGVDGSGSGEHQNLSDSFQENRRSVTISCVFYTWFNLAEYISSSLLLLPIYIILLVLPISAGFMGATYMDKCPVSLPTPLLLFMMGIVGTIVIFCRMGIVIARRFMPGNTCGHAKILVIFGTFFVLLCYSTELLCFSKVLASFKTGAENFCNETFYNYTYYANWTFLGVILAVIMFYLPHLSIVCGCFKDYQSVQTDQTL